MPKSLSLSALLLISLSCLSVNAQTNFGSVAVYDHATMDVPVTVPAASSFTSINAVILGTTLYSDFGKIDGGTCATGVNYTAGETCTVRVMFTPRYPGLRMGAVVLHSSATNAFAITYIEGTGTGTSIVFSPAPAIASGSQDSPSSPFTAAKLANPQYPAYDGNQNLYLFDPTIATGAVVKIPFTGEATTSTLIPRGTSGQTVGTTIKAIAVDGAGNRIIVGQNIAFSMPQGSNTGQVYQDSYAGPASGASFTAAAVDAKGNIFLLNAAYGDIIEFPGGDSQATPTHYPLMVDGEPLMNPSGLAVDGMGNLYVSDTGNNRVVEYPAGGGAPNLIAPTVHGKTLNAPGGLAVDGVGSLYICDTMNHRVVEIPAGGSPAFEIIPTVNNIPLGAPKGITIIAGGSFFIADPDNARVVEVMGIQTPSLSFSPTAVGATSSDSPQTVEVQNIGTDSFNFTGVTFPTNFPAGSSANACTSFTVLGAGQVCELSVTFKPHSPGVFKDAVQVSTPGTYVYNHQI
ncbi:MAG TPA: NHL repeat-containing protein, partial [Acidobacteriaceae bacterium]